MNASEPRGYKGSRTTGEPLQARFEFGAPPDPDREWLRQIGLDVEARTPKHRSQVIWTEGYRFKINCKTCGLLPHPDHLSKEALEGFARAHEAEHS